MKNTILIGIFLCLVLVFIFRNIIAPSKNINRPVASNTPILWTIRSIDTMKTSRDIAREELNDKFIDTKIKKELQIIKNTSANYVAIDTPYDEQFYPVLKNWVDTAHALGLHVWFRGNWSSWEGWFNYPKNLTRDDHLNKTKDFILSHPDLFRDGDIFTPCPECEYGGPGSPLSTGDITGFRQFMIDEYNMMRDSFNQISKHVEFNLFSINPDVAKVVYNDDLLNKTGNIITLDYYTKDAKQLNDGLDYFHEKFPNSKIVLGEFGAPIPDINGSMTEDEQAKFIDQIMGLILDKNYVIGANYWVDLHGSTALFNDDLTAKEAATVIKRYYNKTNNQ